MALDWRQRRINGRYVLAASDPVVTPPDEPDEELPELALDQQLREWAVSEAWEIVAPTYHAVYTDILASATIRWPDRSEGLYTLITPNPTLHQADSFSLTHAASGKTITRTVKARNAEGNALGFTTVIS